MVKIVISVSHQTLTYTDDDGKNIEFLISTAINGIGEKQNSGKTPLGKHIVRAKIGDGLPINSVFVGRRPTGEIFSPELGLDFPDRDWILSRLLWLSGAEPGINRLGDVDTMRRFIYIHGTADEHSLGQAVSHGCIRMANTDMIHLFDLTPIGCSVEITS